MKNAIALAWNNRAVLSPHIGDLDAPRSLEIFEQVIADLQQLYGVKAQAIVCDAHPGYASSRWAAKQGLPLYRVHHHHAHASALAFEGGLDKTWLTFTWDGVGSARTTHCGAARRCTAIRAHGSASPVSSRSGCRAANAPDANRGAPLPRCAGKAVWTGSLLHATRCC